VCLGEARVSCSRRQADLQLACHLACDMITTAVIGLYLYRSKTGWSQTDAILVQLMVMTVESQLPPTIL
jgi:hypothetical protein